MHTMIETAYDLTAVWNEMTVHKIIRLLPKIDVNIKRLPESRHSHTDHTELYLLQLGYTTFR